MYDDDEKEDFERLCYIGKSEDGSVGLDSSGWADYDDCYDLIDGISRRSEMGPKSADLAFRAFRELDRDGTPVYVSGNYLDTYGFTGSVEGKAVFTFSVAVNLSDERGFREAAECAREEALQAVRDRKAKELERLQRDQRDIEERIARKQREIEEI